jgi:ABC-2 type transport system ATP-binding protein
MRNVIELYNLKKVFTLQTSLKNFFLRKNMSTTAIDDVSLNICQGEIFGLLGPNGAGKTTLIKILTTLILPTDGTAKVYGYNVITDAIHIKNLIGLIHSDERSFFWRLTGRQNLQFFAALFKLPGRVAKKRIDELLALVDLERQADNIFHMYSTGMKQRLAIARGLLNNPKILFMDEPMRSIDPINTQKIRKFIRNMALDVINGAVIIATNRLDEATSLCDRVAILNKGRLVASGSIRDLETISGESIQYELEVDNLNDETIQRIRSLRWVQRCEKTEYVNGKANIVLNLAREKESLHSVLQEIIRNKGYIQKCSRKQSSLEDSFNLVISKSEVNQNKVST